MRQEGAAVRQDSAASGQRDDATEKEAVAAAVRSDDGARLPPDAGATVAEDPTGEYARWLVERWADSGVTLRVVVDPGNGCWSGLAADLLRRVFPRSTVVVIHDRRDGLFSDRSPDSARPEHLRALAAAVRRAPADLGVAFDGDGDRIALVDDTGCCLSAEEAIWVLLHSFGGEWRGRLFVHDIKLSRRIPVAVEQYGGRTRAERSGHAFLRNSMLDHGALFGAEISGHYFYDELAGGDDALFTACRVISYLARSGLSLSRLRRRTPSVHLTGDLRVAVPPAAHQDILDGVAARYAGHPLDYIDGVRVSWPQGWALVRSSVTAPQLTFRFEGDTPEWLDRLVRQFAGGLGAWEEPLLRQYEQDRAAREAAAS